MNLLAQMGADPRAFIFGELLYLFILGAWFFLLFVGAVMLVMGLISIRRRRGKTLAAVGGLVVGLLLGTAYVTVAAPHHTIKLSLAESRTPPTGKWQLLYGDKDMLTFDGQVDAQIELPGGFKFDDRASFVEIDRHQGKVVNVLIRKEGLTLDQGYDAADKFIRDWGFDRKNLNQWYQDRKANKRALYGEDRLFYSYRNGMIPGLSLELREISGSWYLVLGASWALEATSQPSTRRGV